eukprot:TRINITY_DN18956_c0_g1_i5.p2 TRINITY_DN18956_c0_g1~~TRINITY_DN18956_c0_g1_i5.p2  ORF type:complete len:174 (-),score=49.54 TRINITY_DN18956_c0_g1_i5:12-533(-)
MESQGGGVMDVDVEAAAFAVPVPRQALRALLLVASKLLGAILKKAKEAVQKKGAKRQPVGSIATSPAPKAMPGKNAKPGPTPKAMPRTATKRPPPPALDVVDLEGPSVDELKARHEVAKRRRAAEAVEKRKAELHAEHERERRAILARHAKELMDFQQKCKEALSAVGAASID